MHAARTVRFDVFGVPTTTQDPRRPRRGPANSLLRTPPLPLLQCNGGIAPWWQVRCDLRSAISVLHAARPQGGGRDACAGP